MNICHLNGKNRNEFVVCTYNNPLTYVFSSANLDAAGQCWVAHLASYNFSLEYRKGKDNTVADFLSWMNERLPEEEVQEYLNKIPYPWVKAVLDNAITPSKSVLSKGVRPTPDCQGDCQEETVGLGPQGWPLPMSWTGNKSRRRIQSSIRWLNT